MDQLICASLFHTHYWFEVGMLKVPCYLFSPRSLGRTFNSYLLLEMLVYYDATIQHLSITFKSCNMQVWRKMLYNTKIRVIDNSTDSFGKVKGVLVL